MRHGIRSVIAVLVLAAAGDATAACTDAAAVAAAREQVAQTCDCAGARSHPAFVRCAAGVARTLMGQGSLPRTCRPAVTRCARASECGAPGSVTCCRTREGVTRCRREGSVERCTARGGTPCTGAFGTCCEDCPGCTTTTTTTSSTTSTTLEPCGGPADPECGGACLAGAVCQGGQTVQGGVATRFCECVSPTARCGPFESDCDFGVCPPGELCTKSFDELFCGCRRPGIVPPIDVPRRAAPTRR